MYDIEIFLYASGHGTMKKNEDKFSNTYIQHAMETDKTCITNWAFKYAKKSNTKVFALNDCCRGYSEFKGGENYGPPAFGCYYIGYAVKAGSTANAG